MTTRRAFLASTAALSLVARASAASRGRLDTSLLQNTMAHGRFVAYQPTALKAIDGKLTQASDDSIRADLTVLRPWFDGLITYGAQNGNERVPDIAASLGFHAVIMGVWDPGDEHEVGNAIAAWRRNRKLVAGLSLGNEIVFGKRGTWDDLSEYLRTVRAEAPGLPLTVSEPFAEYLDHPEALAVLKATDFMLVNIHPVFEFWFKTGNADNWTDFVMRVMARLKGIYKKPILVKETGVPTGPAAMGFNDEMQRAFYNLLAKRLQPSRHSAFAYFTAFDEPWRTGDFNPTLGVHPEEAFWGLFTEARAPKPLMADLPKLPSR